MKENNYDELLNIKTVGELKGFVQSIHYHRYEPTPYHALERLFSQYKLNQNDRIVDFGCGKGRLTFYANHLFRVRGIGIEMNKNLYLSALSNLENFQRENKGRPIDISFEHCLAQDYEIKPFDNRFYFFNPFSVQIFMTVINNILVSVEKYERQVELILYYSSNEYIYFLENHTSFNLVKEIILPEQFKNNQNERFLIYQLK